MSKYLVVLDADKIKQYVYSSSTLKSIRGASSILAELNEKKAVEERVKAHNGECIYAGGGQVMAKFNSDKQADEFISAEQAEYKKNDASITGIKEEYMNGFSNVVKRAQTKLRRAKEERVYGAHLLTNPFFKTCQLCGLNPASKIKYERFVCTVCERKVYRGEEIRKNSKKSLIYARFLNFVKGHSTYQEWEKAEFTEDLSELAELSKPKNYLGLIYVDGNRMGERLFNQTKEIEYQELSKAIENGLQESVFESLLKYIPNPSDGKIPFEFVILGGDDLILLTSAQKVIPITLEILEKFEEKTRKFAKKFCEEKLTLSGGVVIAHSKFPILSFTKMAEDLLISAKKLNKEKWYGAERKLQKKEISTVDYLVITTPSVNSVKVIRDRDLTYTTGEYKYTHRLTQRPFTLEKANRIINFVREIRKSRLSRSRLYSIYDALHKGKNQSILNILSLVTRLDGEEKRNIEQLFGKIKNDSLLYPNSGDLFPWNDLGGFKYDTPLLDMLEIYDFLEENRQ